MPIDPTERTFVVDDRGNVLRGDAAASYLRAIADGLPVGGVDVFHRSLAKQKQLYERYLAGTGPIAAKPKKTAPHVDGRAFDTHTGGSGPYAPSDAHVWLTDGGDGAAKPQPGEKLRAHDYGFRRTVKSERWHFEYDRNLDLLRSDALAAHLAALGHATLKEFQAAVGLKDDGVDGPCTWTALLELSGTVTRDPAPVAPVPPGPEEVKFRAATYNAQLAHFGGGPSSANAAFVQEVLKPSVLTCQEVDEDARDAIRESTGFKVWPYKTLGVFWDPDKYDHGDPVKLGLGPSTNRYHGMVGTMLTSRKNGNTFFAAAVHIRPKAAFSSATAAKEGKKRDIAEVIDKLKSYPRVLVGGDWSSNARPIMEAAGYRLVTPYVDTYDEAGTQHIDSIFVRGIKYRGSAEFPTDASDHDGVTASLTLPAPGAPA